MLLCINQYPFHLKEKVYVAKKITTHVINFSQGLSGRIFRLATEVTPPYSRGRHA